MYVEYLDSASAAVLDMPGIWRMSKSKLARKSTAGRYWRELNPIGRAVFQSLSVGLLGLQGLTGPEKAGQAAGRWMDGGC